MPSLRGSAFRALFELCTEAALVADAVTGHLVDANPMALLLLDRSLEEIQALHYLDLHPQEDRPAVRALFEAGRDLPEDLPPVFNILRGDGSRFPCEVRGRFFEVEGSRYALGLFRDITERKRAAEEIHLRNIAIANVSSGITIADARQPDLPLIYVNQAFEHITGYTAREAIGRSCRFLQSDDRDQPQLLELRAALREGRACNVRLRNYRKNGELFWNELLLSPVRNESGVLTHFVGVQIDVTDRVQSRQAVEDSERRYRLLADSVEDMILRRTLDGHFEDVSRAAYDQLGFSPAALMQVDFFDLVHPEDRPAVKAKDAAILAGQGPVTSSYRLRGSDGEYRWVESTDSLAHSEPAPTIVSVCRDVTLRRRAEEEIRRALERERQLNEIKTRFISMVSHEFRTPLTGIHASTALLRDFAQNLSPEKRARHFENIDRSIARLNTMLDQILLVSRSESGRMEYRPRVTPLRPLIEDIVDEVTRGYPDRHVCVCCDLAELPKAVVDPDLLRHILQNLLTNALKYSRVPTAVDLCTRWAEDVLHLTVRDEGIGIPAAERETIFEPFVRATNTGTIRGTGLGLNIVKRSVELHGGQIRFDSDEGHGTRFEVELPAPRG